ncbi:MAG: bile acid:sodium symporter family protein [Bacillota bacterium]|nr:bile acid:sodium symporter family protein [Bacillota bacterium]
MIEIFNKTVGKLFPFLTPTSMVTGILLSAVLIDYVFLVPWIFGIMTFLGSLGLNFKDLKNAIAHPMPILVTIAILHLIMPGIAWTVGHIFFAGDSLVITGLVLSFTVPIGITSMIWVSLYRGNLALTLSIILINTLFSPFLVSYSLKLFVGAQVSLDLWGIMQGLLGMVVFPSLFAMLLNQLTKGEINQVIGKPLAPFTKLGLLVVIAINSSTVAPYIQTIDLKLIAIAFTMLALAAIGYGIGWLVAKAFGWDRETIIALTYNTGMRNISAGAVIAITFFPTPVAIPVIMGMLFQQLLAAIYGKFLSRSYGDEVAPIEGRQLSTQTSGR